MGISRLGAFSILLSCLLMVCLSIPAQAQVIDTDGDGLPNEASYPYEDNFETGDFSALPWVLSGELNWYVKSETPQHGGQYVARSPLLSGGNAFNPKVIGMAVTVTLSQPGEVRFLWYVGWNCDALCGLKLRIDGINQTPNMNYLLPQDPFKERIYSISAGTHTVKWEYGTSGTMSTGDRAGVDNVRIGSMMPVDPDDDNDGLPDVMDPLPLQATFNRDGNYKGSVIREGAGLQ